MEISAQLVKQLRERTGAGMMECKKALVESKGDLGEAEVVLRKAGIASAAKKSTRSTKQGVIGNYIHAGAQIGVLIEVNCESDFVARTDAFQELVKDLGMQIAAQNPSYVAREEIPNEIIEKEREIYRGQLADQKKPAQVIDKIIEGKLDKFFTEQCLLEQPFVKDPSGKTKIRELVDGVNAKTGERIVVKRFARFQVGEGG